VTASALAGVVWVAVNLPTIKGGSRNLSVSKVAVVDNT